MFQLFYLLDSWFYYFKVHFDYISEFVTGNSKNEFENVDVYESYNKAHQFKVLIDRMHKSVKPSKYQQNVGYLLNKESNDKFDN